jgi:xanthine dehydrogenase accessory factor
MADGARLVWTRVADALARYGRAAIVTMAATRGSSPREAGARMIVHPDGTFTGTIGGGTLEWKAIALAQAAFADVGADKAAARGFALGPELGQCCGGNVDLIVELVEADRRDEIAALAAAEENGPIVTAGTLNPAFGIVRTIVPGDLPPGAASFIDGVLTEGFGDDRRNLYLFGAGHVGRALVMALAPLAFRVTWIDPRPDAFPAFVPGNTVKVQAEDPAAALARAPDGAFILVMTHSHQLDLAIVAAAFGEGRFPYIGLIGSKSKRARFEKRLAAGGIPAGQIASLVCPIGGGGAKSKDPAVIAAMTTAELLQRDEALRMAKPEPEAARQRRA